MRPGSCSTRRGSWKGRASRTRPPSRRVCGGFWRRRWGRGRFRGTRGPASARLAVHRRRGLPFRGLLPDRGFVRLVEHSHDHVRGRVDNDIVSVDDSRNHSALSGRGHRVDRRLPAGARQDNQQTAAWAKENPCPAAGVLDPDPAGFAGAVDSKFGPIRPPTRPVSCEWPTDGTRSVTATTAMLRTRIGALRLKLHDR